jgi:hypothetical protein
MDATELGLPQHLYTETRDENGTVTGITILPDKLVDWSTHRYGDSIDRLCRQVYDSELDVIHAWEQTRLLLLEEQWLTLENGVDDDEHELQYHLDCDAVAREAETRRAAAKARMNERKAAIEKLVLRASAHLKTHEPAEQEVNYFGYLFAAAAVGTVAYVMMT